MKLLFQILCLAAALLGPSSGLSASPPPKTPVRDAVFYIQVQDQAITPVLARLLLRALDAADSSGARCVVIELDTPGGLVDSTRQIVKKIVASRIPVVVFVAPPGARSASGGMFITLCAHVAAMAPGTHIGTAHPVAIGAAPGEMPGQQAPENADNPPDNIMAEKAVSDIRAWARSLAEMRGRNADWAELAVTESSSITAQQALEKKVIDLLADDLPDLLQKLDGVIVEVDGHPVTLQTKNAPVHTVTMWWGDRLLSALSVPNIAFLLLILGFYGLLFEFYTPGWGVAGTLGAVCLVLAFFGLAVLPVSYAGLTLIGVAIALFVAEAFVTSFGALTVGGCICLVLGGLMLIDSPHGFLRVSASVVLPMAAATALITVFLVTRIVKGRRSPVQTGDQSLPGTKVTAVQSFRLQESGYAGTVRMRGELWNATADSPVAAGETLVVCGRRGLVLRVEHEKERQTN